MGTRDVACIYHIIVLRCVAGRVRTRRPDHDAYVAAACMLRDALQHSNTPFHAGYATL